EIARKKWRAKSVTGVQSTTRLVRISLKEGVTQERLPHQLKIAGGNVLVVAPGRAPLCLRWKGRGHIRRECRVPRCDGCHRIGHERENCARSYAAVTQKAAGTGDGTTLEMEEEEAEDAARETEPEVPAPVRKDKAAVAAADGVNTPGEQYGKDTEEPASSQGSSEGYDVAVVPQDQDPEQPSGAGSQVTETVDKEGANVRHVNHYDSDMHEAGTELKQRQGGHAGEGNLTACSEFKWRTQMVKKERFNPNLRMPQEDHRRTAPQ
ncbi:uncharacterized protein LOC8040866, partial [Ixodes scapularis]|uniref:uncharacterized protein LOC8040866 n=1 Tax=Ixodes scapularis TaxID=6945 RepID=UPI001A9F9054